MFCACYNRDLKNDADKTYVINKTNHLYYTELTCLHIACNRGHNDIVSFLIEHGVDYKINFIEFHVNVSEKVKYHTTETSTVELCSDRTLALLSELDDTDMNTENLEELCMRRDFDMVKKIIGSRNFNKGSGRVFNAALITENIPIAKLLFIHDFAFPEVVFDYLDTPIGHVIQEMKRDPVLAKGK